MKILKWESLKSVLDNNEDAMNLKQIIDQCFEYYPDTWKKQIGQFAEGETTKSVGGVRAILENKAYRDIHWERVGMSQYKSIISVNSDVKTSKIEEKSREHGQPTLKCGFNVLRERFDWQKMKVRQFDEVDQEMNLNEIEGIYILRKGDQVVYIGQGNVGKRLRSHERNSLWANRWDAFDWFEWSERETRLNLEALLIQSFLPRLNKKGEETRLDMFEGINKPPPSFFVATV